MRFLLADPSYLSESVTTGIISPLSPSTAGVHRESAAEEETRSESSLDRRGRSFPQDLGVPSRTAACQHNLPRFPPGTLHTLRGTAWGYRRRARRLPVAISKTPPRPPVRILREWISE